MTTQKAADVAARPLVYTEVRSKVEEAILGTVAGEESRRQMSSAVDLFLENATNEALKNVAVVAEGSEEILRRSIAALDEKISAQVREILHNEEFQKLEASWRGLAMLAERSNTGVQLRLKVLNVSKDELAKDFEKNKKSDQSTLHKRIYAEEFGTAGGLPFGALIGDYEFDPGPRDLPVLRRIAGVAAAAHAPFIAAAKPDIFGLKDYTELDQPQDLASIFKADEYAGWREFRQTEDARYVALTLPHVLMRLPYGPDTKQIEEFAFDEKVQGRDHKKYLWGNAAFAFGTCITRAFAEYGWPTAVVGEQGGGKVEQLPLHFFKTAAGTKKWKCPTESLITDTRELELSNLGFMPLVYKKETESASFYAAQSVQQPQAYDVGAATGSAELSAQIPYVMACSRIAHYMKVMVRERIGRFETKETLQSYLTRWLNQYVVSNEDANQDMKAKYPLQSASVSVEDDPKNRPGFFQATAHLKPHIQFRGLTASMRLVTQMKQQ